MVRKSRAALRTEEVANKALDQLTGFYEAEMISHFREEEEQIFPLLVDANGHIPDELARAMSEHLRIHALVMQLRRLPSIPLMEELLDVIEDHVRLEEKQLFPLIEERHASQLEMVQLATRDRSSPSALS
jgi:iron-sulfur cluster repair protein YtfE (RIC family)